MRKILLALAAGSVIGLAPIASDAFAQHRSGGFARSSGMSMGARSFAASRVGTSGARISGARIGGPRVGARIGGPRIAAAHVGGPRVYGGKFHGRKHFVHRKFRRHFAFAGPIVGAYAYSSCYRWRQVLTPWGWQWRRVNVCYRPVYYRYGYY
jgi:hypothetical protein